MELLHQIFCPEDVNAISALPAPNSQHIDRLVWYFSKIGEFSVRSAYNLVGELEGRHSQVGQSDSAAASQAWVRNLHRNLESWEYRLAIVIAWNLWNSRNLLLMEHRLQSPMDVVIGSRRLLQDYESVCLPSNHMYLGEVV
ncbi:hypothetical protein Salat_0633400 [Sesamum alatum]|uniref:Uncharacterized protein n=1 Tax=Sesamum alatum TaxID=300844 RepID=A0AAE2CU61_9LAMI|nr:hypothetical protein Salat_0633400 [Sesamum alatum]